jgi:anti-anti-sigma factor
MKRFSVASRIRDNIAVLEPEGYLNNLMGEKLEELCEQIMGEGVSRMIVDFSRVEMINSIGISILLSILERTRRADGRICFTNLRPLHDETFQILGLKKHMQVFATVDSALAYLKGDSE